MIQISACKNGDKEALGALYRAYAQKLLDICRHYVKEEEVAEDLLHDAFVVIFNSIGDLREETKIEGWMITIVRNLCLKYLQSVEHNLVSLSELSTEIQDEPYDNKTPTIDLAQLLSAIDALPKGNREVFRLSVLDGLYAPIGSSQRYENIWIRNSSVGVQHLIHICFHFSSACLCEEGV